MHRICCPWPVPRQAVRASRTGEGRWSGQRNFTDYSSNGNPHFDSKSKTTDLCSQRFHRFCDFENQKLSIFKHPFLLSANR